MSDKDSVLDSQVISPPSPFLCQQILCGSVGILTNSYSLSYLLKYFNFSKIIYKLLMVANIINIVQCFIEVFAAIWLLLDTNEIVCIILQISVMAPKFIIQCFLLEICITRCIFIYLKKYTALQKSLVWFISPLPIVYIATILFVRQDEEKPIGLLLLHQVSFYHEYFLLV